MAFWPIITFRTDVLNLGSVDRIQGVRERVWGLGGNHNFISLISN
jgi:hypothetical protein